MPESGYLSEEIKNKRVAIQDYGIAVSRDLVPGVSHFTVIGENAEIDLLTDPEDIWDGGGIYNFSTASTDYYISSGSTVDNQTFLLIILTEDSNGDWNQEEFNFTINGQTKTKIITPSGDPPVRFQRMLNLGSSQNSDVYVYEDDTTSSGVPQNSTLIRAVCLAKNNRTLSSFYTVPSNKTAYFENGFSALSVAKSAYAVVSWRGNFGGGGHLATFLRVGLNSDGTGCFVYNFSTPEGLPAKTDLFMTCEEVSDNDTVVSGGYGLKIYDI